MKQQIKMQAHCKMNATADQELAVASKYLNGHLTACDRTCEDRNNTNAAVAG